MGLVIGGVAVQVGARTLSWTGGLECDADGSPRAYAPPGSGLPARDALGNAGHFDRWRAPDDSIVTDPVLIAALAHGARADEGYKFEKASWWGVVTNGGIIAVQGPHDPAPGYCISPTALNDLRYARLDPRRYVDSEAVPYLSVPPELLRAGARLGDLAVVQRGEVRCGAILADIGPEHRIGEGSIALHQALGFDPFRGAPKHHLLGIEGGVSVTVYTRSGRSPSWPIANVSLVALELAT